MKHAPPTLLLLSLIAFATTGTTSADWPQFHGPNRDNRSTESALLDKWPGGGPPILWQAKGIGEGYSTVAIDNGRVFITGAVAEDCLITALSLKGEKVWTYKNGKAWKKSYPGTRSTPTIVDGLLYHQSGTGNLVCLRSDTGKKVWSTNILEAFDGRNIMWGLAESPLVVGDLVICTPGGKEISMAALDRKTGEVVWKCTGAGDKPGYASPILVDHDGLQQIVTAMSESIVGVRVSDGELLWRYPHKVYADENITTPLFRDGVLIVSGCVRKGTTALRLQVANDKCTVTRHWHNSTLDNKQGGLVLLDNRIYGYAESQNRSEPWMCIDFESGKTVFQEAPLKSSYKYKNGCLTCAGGMLYLYSDNGNMALVKPAADGFDVRGRIHIANPGKNPTWAHPVVCDGTLYLRFGDNLRTYDIRSHKERK